MADTGFVFRYRSVLIALIYVVGFGLSAVDHVNAAVALVRLATPGAAIDASVATPAVRVVFAAGAMLVVAAALLRTWAAAYIETSVVHDSQVHAESLVASGPYRYVRNPLYVGTTLLAVGFALVASRLGAIIILVGSVSVQLWLIHGEERELSRTQGASFEAYRRAVPRYIPALRPRVADSGKIPRWPQAFVGEAFMWVFALAAVAWAATLKMAWMSGMAFAGWFFNAALTRVVIAKRTGRARSA